jgi:hypothetical protein
LGHIADDGGDLVGSAHVADPVHGRHALGPQQLDCLLEIGLLSAADGDPGAVLAERPGDLQSEAGRAAGHKCHLAFEQVCPERAWVDGHRSTTTRSNSGGRGVGEKVIS